MIIKFFENLSYKFRTENSISDVTWSLCEASNNFRDDFLKFFFPQMECNELIIFQREYSLNDSRPDFYLETKNGEKYIIEVKLYDTNQHFEQYINTFQIPNENLGYITNYTLRKDGFETKTWQQFYKFLEISKTNLTELERELYEGYIFYLKNVCSIVIIKEKMDLKNTYTLYSFNEILKKVLDRDNGEFRLSIYKQEIKSHRSGYYFQVSDVREIVNKKNDIWLWAGIYYNMKNPQVYLEIDNNEGWGKPFFEILDESEADDIDEGSYWFKLDMNHINELETIEQQEKFLKDFIDKNVGKYFEA